MGWFRSADATSFVVDRRQFMAQRGSDGLYYFELPSEMAHHALSNGFAPSSPPPPTQQAAAQEPPIDKEALVKEITEKVEQKFRDALEAMTPPRPT